MKDYGFVIFVFFVVVFLLLLTGGNIIRYLKNAKKNAKKAADERAQNYRDETARQQRQYYYNRQAAAPKGNTKPRAEQVREPEVEEPVETHTKTATGETIIDRRSGRENKKIYKDAEGEYVEFSEE
ncbi:MAG: DUF4834 family protein [Prevotella sp.]|nr:DUF4834 family protein [Prevotella sp.]